MSKLSHVDLTNTEFQYILTFNMNTSVRFIKSFSKGQITIPKEFRDAFGIENEFWLKIYVADRKIIAEPMEQKKDRLKWRKRLLKMKPINISMEEIEKNREEIEEQIKKRTL